MYQSPAIIKEVGELLQQPLSAAGVVLKLSNVRYKLAKETATMLRLLYEKRKQMLWPKDFEKGLTELDRTTRLDGDLAPMEADYQFMLKLDELIVARIELASAIGLLDTR